MGIHMIHFKLKCSGALIHLGLLIQKASRGQEKLQNVHEKQSSTQNKSSAGRQKGLTVTVLSI